MTLWLTIIAAGIGTFLIRGSMLLFLRHDVLPASARDALRYVMPAVLSAIAVPAVLYAGGNGAFDASPGNERLVAALVAVVIARVTASVWLTIGAGMTTLWAITAIT